MKTLDSIVALLLVLIISSGCTTFHSAKGIDKGDVMLSYHAPFAGTIRYGVTQHIESQFTVFGWGNCAELFYHQHNNAYNFDYGLSAGIMYDYKDYSPILSAVISKEYKGKINPYISYFYDFNDVFEKNTSLSYWSVGCEIFSNDNKGEKFVITPEIGIADDVFDEKNKNATVWGTISLGWRFNFSKD